MKILNLYSGIGGNRKLWTPNGNEHDIIAIENNPEIAKIYSDFFPNDKMIITDAHQYLLEHFKEFDFIWSSPPCPTHSRLRLLSVNRDLIKLEYPDMALYQEIIILQSFCKAKFIIENVIGYYEPLIAPQKSGRHYFWANFKIRNIQTEHLSIKNKPEITVQDRMDMANIYIQNWHNYKGDKHKLLKNCVDAELGLHILNDVLEITEVDKYGQSKLFE